MVVARQLLAALLAVLIANPVCCCTAGSILGDSAEQAAPASAHSCCAKKSAPTDVQHPASPVTPEPEELPTCLCAMDDSMVVEAKLAKLDRALPPNLDWEFPVRIEVLPIAGLERPTLTHRFDLPPPPAPWRLLCRYLL